MSRLFVIFFALLAVPAFGQGWQQGIAAAGGNAGSGYVGWGDVQSSGWVFYCGTRGFNEAYHGDTAHALRVRRASDSAETDINILLGGDLDTVSLANFIAGTSGFLVTCYDQTSTIGNCTQGTAALQPQILLSTNGIGGRPSVTLAGALYCTITGVTQAQPFTLLQSTRFGTPNSGSNRRATGFTGSTVTLGYSTTDSLVHATAGSGVASSGTYAVDSWHTIGFVGNGASSIISVDQTQETVSAGTNGASAGTLYIGGSGLNSFVGSFAESAVYNGALSAGTLDSLASNSCHYYGFC